MAYLASRSSIMASILTFLGTVPDLPGGAGSKMGIDATWPMNKAIPPYATVPKETSERVAGMWQSYRIPAGRA